MKFNKLKFFISCILVFHLFVIFLYPNSSSYLLRVFGPVIHPYANALGVNSTWRFYAPEPETAVHLEYDIDRIGQSVGEEKNVYAYPAPGFDINFLRKSASRGLMMYQKEFIGSVFIPWVCRMHPEAYSVTVRGVYYKVPSLDDVQNGSPMFDPSDKKTEELNAGVCQR